MQKWRGANAVRSQQNAQRSQLREHDLKFTRDLLRLVGALPGPRHERLAGPVSHALDSVSNAIDELARQSGISVS